MKLRVITGFVAAAALALLLVQHVLWETPLLLIAIYAFYIIALSEIIAAFRNKGLEPVRWAIYLAGVILMPAYYWRGTDTLMSALFLSVFLALCASIFRRDPREGDFLATCFPLIYPTIPFLALFMLAMLPQRQFLVTFIAIFITSISSDVFALLVGVRFGKHKLIPSVSPKKTWEGAIGGLAASILFTVLYGVILNHFLGYNFRFIHFVGLGAVGSIATQLGDLVASVIKRYCGVKDFGKIFPGHGGVLDRMDGMTLNALLTYVYFIMVMGFVT